MIITQPSREFLLMSEEDQGDFKVKMGVEPSQNIRILWNEGAI
jgi:hypothetical protein